MSATKRQSYFPRHKSSAETRIAEQFDEAFLELSEAAQDEIMWMLSRLQNSIPRFGPVAAKCLVVALAKFVCADPRPHPGDVVRELLAQYPEAE